MDEDIEALRQEKEKAEKKLKLMADIVEKLSKKPESSGFDIKAVVEPRIKEINDKLEFKTQEIEKALAEIREKVKKPGTSKDFSVSIKNIEARLGKLEEISKNIESISELGQKINELINKQSSQPKEEEQKSQQKEPININYDAIMARISALENRLNSQEIEKMKQFLNSKDALIRETVQEEAEKKFGYVLRGLEELENGVRKLGREVTFSLKEIDVLKGEIKTLNLIKEDLLNFKREKESLYAAMDVRREEMERFIEKTKKGVKAEMKEEVKNISSAVEGLKASVAKMNMLKKDIDTKLILLRNETNKLIEARSEEIMEAVGKNINDIMVDVEKRFENIGRPVNEERLKSMISKEREFIKKSIDSKMSRIEEKTADRLKSIEVRLAKNEAKLSALEKDIRIAVKSKKEMDEQIKKRDMEIKRLLGELR